ncbi:MAG TPA: hypothetical protein VH138_18265, partial [Vicinamibacterales bacterium]|nr:hypothetical protein [Vicinamibacterales bacterium]
MSRIDEALKRLTGIVGPEHRAPSVLERYVSEGAPAPAERVAPARPDDVKKVASFFPPSRRMREEKLQPAQNTAAETPAARRAVQEHDSAFDSAPLVDVALVLDYLRFVGASLRRHKVLATATVAMVLGTTLGVAQILPKRYHIQTKLLAQRNAVMAALSNPNRAVPWDADAPTRAAAETVLRRDNLVALIKQTNLVNEWDRTRPRALKFKDWMIATLRRHQPTQDEKLDTMIGTLESKMIVVAGPVGDGTVTIGLDWPDAEMGYRLVQAAQESFVQARLAAETAAIGESIAILERYSGSLHEDINRTLTELQRTQAKAGAAAPGTRPVVTRPLARAVQPPDAVLALIGDPHLDDLEKDPDLSRMKDTLTQKRRDLARMEEDRQRQLADLQTRLAQLKTVYTADHPSVISTQQSLAALMQDTPQALTLAAQIEELQADYDRKLSAAADLQKKTAAASARAVPRTTPAADAPVADVPAAV